MLKEYTAQGNNVNEAIEKGLAALGKERDDVSVEIIEMEKKGFFGKIKVPATVKLSYDDGVNPEKPKKKAKPQPKSKEQSPVKNEQAKPADEKNESDIEEKRPEFQGDIEKKIEIAENYISDIIKAMGLTAQINVTTDENGALINLVGEDLGVIIGRRGETIDALQYLISLVSNRIDSGYYRIAIDCGDFREKREQTLKELAAKIARNVLKTGRSTTLEPMNPYERKIIHAVISETDGVYSKSIGEEPYRKVVVSSQRKRSDKSSKQKRDRVSSTVSTKPDPAREKKSDDVSTALYGKIEL